MTALEIYTQYCNISFSPSRSIKHGPHTCKNMRAILVSSNCGIFLEISHKRSKMKWQARTPEIHADDNIQLDHSLIGSTRDFIENFETSIVSIGNSRSDFGSTKTNEMR